MKKPPTGESLATIPADGKATPEKGLLFLIISYFREECKPESEEFSMILGQATQENTNRPHIPCIYKIENKKTGAVYIGSTKDFSNRYRQHKNKLVNGKHNSRAMQRDFNKGDPLDMTVIEDCTGLSAAELLQHEQAQIVKYGSLENGYNTAVAWCGDLPQALCMSNADTLRDGDSLRQQLEDVTADRDALRDQLRQIQADHRQELDRLRTDHRQQLDDLRHDLTESRLQLDRLTFDRDRLQQQLDNEKWWSNHYKESLESEQEEHRRQRETSRKLETTLFKMLETANNAALERIKQSRQPQRKPTLWERVFRKGA